jgi:hypothetical protein
MFPTRQLGFGLLRIGLNTKNEGIGIVHWSLVIGKNLSSDC